MLEEKIGFDQICTRVAAECSNPMAVQMAQHMRFTNDYDQIMAELMLTEEFRQIILRNANFPTQDFYDLTPELTRLKVVGAVIELSSLATLKSSLHTLTDCLRFLLGEEQSPYPLLRHMAAQVELDPTLSRTLAKIVDDRGEIQDNASPQLADIRHQMRHKQSAIDTKIAHTLSYAKQQGWAPDNGEATIRNGRLVIPLLDTHRRKVKGFIIDESATRQTAYIEPAEVVELNNDLRELEFAEQHEIRHILSDLSERLRPMIPALLNAYRFLARIDFLRAKARFALQLGAGLPHVEPVPQIHWLEARHPLLRLSFQQHHSGEVVPFNMDLTTQASILIISGPNAGGKSVCLKAVGLIQYMLQAGLLVPLRETSECGIFDRLFIDIGDQQSIENDLSTYSSHLQNMTLLLQQATSQSLFLLDELGGGTEPRSGCAIAEAVLEALYARHCFGVVTTHFADLKMLADSHPGIINGAMLFDTKAMRPLYQLSIGHPGSSFAFEIARNIGFPTDVLDAAMSKVGHTTLNYEQQLQEIAVEKQALEKQRQELQVSDDFLNEVVQKYQRLYNQLEQKRHELLAQARQQARQIITDANKQVEKTIADIKTAHAEKQQTAAARAALRAAQSRLDEAQQHDDQALRDAQQASPIHLSERQAVTADDVPADGPIAVGDIVRMGNGETFGEVIAIEGSKAVVESNSLRMTLPLNRLVKTRKKHLPSDRPQATGSRFQSIYDDINDKRLSFSPQLDLRGHRAEEALVEVDHFIDEALLLGEKELRILHGKGYGILKSLVRQHLQANPDVQSYHAERVELGGDGITVVHLK